MVAALFTGACQREPAPITDTAAGAISTTGTETGGGVPLNAPPTSTNADALQASAGDVVRNPAQYAGRVITVTGDVERVISPRAFTMDSGITPRGELLVLSRDPVPGVLEAGQTRALFTNDDAIVTGRVRNMVVTEIERELGWDLDSEIEVEFENQPVLIIESIRATAGSTQE